MSVREVRQTIDFAADEPMVCSMKTPVTDANGEVEDLSLSWNLSEPRKCILHCIDHKKKFSALRL
jgi:hypothetical protein